MLRRLWGAAASEEESRAYLQSRLTALFQLMFWSFSALLVFLWVLYRFYPDIEPRNQRWVFATYIIGLTAMGALWRGVLVRRRLSFGQLEAMDHAYSTGCGLAIAACAVISYDLRPSAYTCLLYACFTVLTRALIVPSTGTRTALASTLTFVPMTIGGVALALRTDQEVPGPMYFSGYVMVAFVAVLLAAGGSRIIYRLNREVSAAEQLGQYRLVKKIAEGGMGAIYLADHVLLRRPTAVKLLLPDKVGADNLERFEREVKLMSLLTHPNTVAVFDYGRSPDGVFYYAMEYLGGGVDLSELVRRHGAQPAARVVDILVQVCGALQEAHDAKLIHRDIKPANIILCERGGMPDIAKVVDFGLVKQITADTGASGQVVLGTPAYIAPEALTEPSAIGPAVELYAVGCVGYELLTGRRVFDGKTAVALCMQHLTTQPTPPSRHAQVPSELEAIILRCLAKQPGERFASAAALADALAELHYHDWDEARARAWWRDHETASPADDEDVPSALTMTIDLGHRVPDQVQPW